MLLLSLLATAILGSLNAVGGSIANVFAKACVSELCDMAAPTPEPTPPVPLYQKRVQ